MEPGRLRFPIEIQQATKTRTPTGGTTTVWTKVFESRCDAKQTRMRDLPVADQAATETYMDFTVRYRPGYEVTRVILFKGDRYEIVSVTNQNERNRELTVRGKKVKPE